VPEILARRGYDPIEFTRKNAEYLQKSDEIATEYGIDRVRLGTSLMPGDVMPDDDNETNQNEET